MNERVKAIKERHLKINENKYLWNKYFSKKKTRKIKKEIDADFIDSVCGVEKDDRYFERKIQQCKEDYYKEAN